MADTPVQAGNHPTGPEHPEALLSAAADVLFEATNEGVTVWVSPGIEDLLGWRPEDLIGRPFREFVDEVASLETLRALQRDVCEGRVGRSRLRVRTSDGDGHWVDVVVRPRLDDEGRVVGRVGSWHDAEAEVAADEALRRAADERAALFASMIDPLVTLQAVRDDKARIVDFVYTDANPAACAYNRVAREDLVGMRLLDLLPEHAATTLIRDYSRVVETGEPLVLDDYAYPREVYGGAERFYDIRAVRLGDGLSYTWRDVTDRHHMIKDLSESRSLLQGALDSELDPHVFLAADRDAAGEIADFQITRTNPAARAYYAGFGRDRDRIVGMTLGELADTGEFARMLQLYAEVVRTGDPLVADGFQAISALSGEARYFDVRGVRVGDGLSLVWRDVTDRVEAAERLAESEEHYRLLAENITDVIVHVREGVIAWVSPSVEALTGRPPEEWVGQPAMAGIADPDRDRFGQSIEEAKLGDTGVARVRFVLPDGTEHWGDVHSATYHDAHGQPDGIIASLRVVDDLVRTEQELAYAAQHDALTGLMNRGEVFRRIGALSGRRPRTGTKVGLLYCDLDGFKAINDRYGHAAGDEVLRTLGSRIASCIRADDLAARTGGDELLVVLAGLHDLDQALAIAEKIRLAAAQPVPLLGGVDLEVTVSIGATLVHPHEDVDAMVARADAAMYRAKSAGRDQIVAIP